MENIITMEEVVANAATIVQAEDREARNLFRQWAYLGARQLLHNKGDIEVDEITPAAGLIAKPKYFVKGKGLALYDSDGGELYWRFNPYTKERIHDTNIYVENRNKGSYPIVTVTEQSDAYALDSYYGDSVALAKLRYYKLPIDANTDEPFFYSNQLLALMFFIQWMWYTRNRDLAAAGAAKADWMVEQHKVKIDNKIPDEMEAQEIAKTWNSMIQKKFYNTF